MCLTYVSVTLAAIFWKVRTYKLLYNPILPLYWTGVSFLCYLNYETNAYSFFLLFLRHGELLYQEKGRAIRVTLAMKKKVDGSLANADKKKRHILGTGKCWKQMWQQKKKKKWESLGPAEGSFFVMYYWMKFSNMNICNLKTEPI